MRISWCAIACINLLWCLLLWKDRRKNHPWLLSFFLVYFISDTLMLLASPSPAGGFDLAGPSLLGWSWWVVVACLAWLSWFAAPVLVACKLAIGRVPVLLTVAVVAACASLAVLELFGFSGLQRRFAMHVVCEPILLIVALIMISYYVGRAVKRGDGIDFLSYAVALTATMLLLKVGLMFDAVGLLKRWQAHTFHYLYMATLLSCYLLQGRFRRWLLFR